MSTVRLSGGFKVKRKHLAVEIGSGTLPVLATPALIGFMENIASDLTQKDLEPKRTSVGIFITMEHIKPARYKDEVRIECDLISVEKNIVTYEIEAFCRDELIGKALHKRAVIDRKTFEDKYNIFNKKRRQ
ncbi:MAG: diaminopimelate epimerase [Spirochaetae bacterium HGW-Spirochaetae-6]|jgi:predicted thioesterase|nr:MAG: diaminopimelate epimerase [Spirochaetae bacterium HGW-Spirochaetae-6]